MGTAGEGVAVEMEAVVRAGGWVGALVETMAAAMAAAATAPDRY